MPQVNDLVLVYDIETGAPGTDVWRIDGVDRSDTVLDGYYKATLMNPRSDYPASDMFGLIDPNEIASVIGQAGHTGNQARFVYDKFCLGDALTDQEVKDGVAFFGELSNKLSSLGPVFRLPANEAHRVYQRLSDFYAARNEG